MDTIVQQVVAAMRQGEGAKPRAASSRACCGEESRLPARQFITAQALQRRLQGGGSHLELATNEFLTPAAQDLVGQMQLSVTRKTSATPAEKPSPSAARPTPTAALPSISCPTGPYALLVDSHNEKTLTTVASLGREGIRLLEFRPADCPIANMQALCEAIGRGQLAGGVAILKYAADAVILANKHQGVRAVQGTRVASVAGAVRHVAANLLILEHGFSTFYELRAMIRTFVADRMLCGIATDVLAAIARAEAR
jgi:ribose 5-phosphate isomerase RpiB